MNFYNFILKMILIYFHLKSDLYKLLKEKNLNPLFLKITFNPILIKEIEFIYLFLKKNIFWTILLKNYFLGQLYLQNNFWTILSKTISNSIKNIFFLKTFFWIFINKKNFLLLKKYFLKYYFIKTCLLNCSSYLNKIYDLFDIQFCTQQINIYKQILTEINKIKNK